MLQRSLPASHSSCDAMNEAGRIDDDWACCIRRGGLGCPPIERRGGVAHLRHTRVLMNLRQPTLLASGLSIPSGDDRRRLHTRACRYRIQGGYSGPERRGGTPRCASEDCAACVERQRRHGDACWRSMGRESSNDTNRRKEASSRAGLMPMDHHAVASTRADSALLSGIARHLGEPRFWPTRRVSRGQRE